MRTVTYRPRGWSFTPAIPVFKVAGLLALVLLGSAGAFGLYQRIQYSEGLRHRQNAQALMEQGDYEGARKQLLLAPEEPDTHRLRARLAVCEGKWEEAAAEFRTISMSDSEVNRHLDETALLRAQEIIKQARQSGDSVRALTLSDQAEQLLELHHGSHAQVAELHFLRAQLFQKLDLTPEAMQELAQTLAHDPRHQAALRLRSLLAPPPAVVARVSRPVAPRHTEPEVDVPRLQTDPGYPVYQPPEPDSSEDADEDESDSERKRKPRKSRKWTDR
ncbi:hypothetical protein JST97_14710 [bacterium]|nr:hypothetical protein [bacterium]